MKHTLLLMLAASILSISGGGSDGHSDNGSTSPVTIGRVYFAKVTWTLSNQ